MARYDKPAFVISDKFEARRAFTFNGKKYAVGAEFPWRRVSCSSRKVRDMFNGNYITSTTYLDEKKAKRAKKVAANEAAKKDAANKPVVKKPAKKSVTKVEKPIEKKAATPSTDEDIKAFVNEI